MNEPITHVSALIDSYSGKRESSETTLDREEDPSEERPPTAVETLEEFLDERMSSGDRDHEESSETGHSEIGRLTGRVRTVSAGARDPVVILRTPITGVDLERKPEELSDPVESIDKRELNLVSMTSTRTLELLESEMFPSRDTHDTLPGIRSRRRARESLISAVFSSIFSECFACFSEC